MSVIPVDEETDAVISELARRLHVSKDAVLRMLIDGELKVGGMDMNEDIERKLKEMLGSRDSGSMIDKLIEMKMMEKLDSDGAKKGNSMDEILEMMKMKMMMEMMNNKQRENIDPNMILMLYLMKGDSSKADMTKIIEAVTNSTQTKDTTLTEVLKELLNEKKETEREQELMGIIEQQNRVIEEMKKQLDEMRRAVLYQREPRERNKGDDEIIGAVSKIERVKDTFERLGLTKPPSTEDREMAIKQDVVKAKAELEKATLERTSEMVDKALDAVDKKMDKILTIVEHLMTQTPQQREQTLDDFERRGQITPEERIEIYKKMQEEVMKEQMAQTTNYTTPEPAEPVQVEDKGAKAREMWEKGFDAVQIARTLHMPITETYKYRPEQKLK